MDEARNKFHLFWERQFDIKGTCSKDLLKNMIMRAGEFMTCTTGTIEYQHFDRLDTESTHTLCSQSNFVIKNIKGKGRGMIATRTLSEGTLLITETPLACSWYFPENIFQTIPEITRVAISWYLQESSHRFSPEQQKTEFKNDSELAHSLASNLGHQKIKWEEYMFNSLIAYRYIHPECTIDENAIDSIWCLFVKHCQISSNSFAVTSLQSTSTQGVNVVSVEQKKNGIAIFPLLSLINHSCSPNAHVSFSDYNQIILRTSQEIPAGSEICISYGCLSSKLSKKERKQLLFQSYYFTCECESCVIENTEKSGFLCDCGGEFMITHSSQVLQCDKCKQEINQGILCKKVEQYEAMLRLGDELVSQQRISQAIRAFEKGLELIVSLVKQMDYRVGRVYDRLAECYALLNRFTESVKYCQKSVDIISSLYGDTAIETTNELLKLVDLYFNARDIDGTLAAIERASRALKVCYGDDDENIKRMHDMKQFLLQKKRK